MQAITTKFHGPTNYKGSRITARSEARRLTVSWDHALNVDENHTRAARMLAEKLGWAGTWHGGGLPTRDGYAFVCAERHFGNTFKVER